MDVANLTPKQRRVKQIWGMLALCICGAAVYELPYLSWSYYDAAVEFYRVSNAQMGYLMTMYGLACVISYLPAGWVADKFQARHLIATALVSTFLIVFAKQSPTTGCTAQTMNFPQGGFCRGRE